MSVRPTIHERDDHDARWEDWQIRNASRSRRDARNSRVVAAVLLGAAAAWVLVELLSSPAFA